MIGGEAGILFAAGNCHECGPGESGGLISGDVFHLNTYSGWIVARRVEVNLAIAGASLDLDSYLLSDVVIEAEGARIGGRARSIEVAFQLEGVRSAENRGVHPDHIALEVAGVLSAGVRPRDVT
jgi:hypothetical protein